MNNDLISRSALLDSYDVRKVTEYDESGCGMDYKAVPVDVIAAAPAVAAAPQWISVQDRLPEDAGGAVDAVLVTDGFLIHMAYFNHGTWYFCESGEMKEEMFYNVSYWMPLPDAPKEG